MPTPHGSDAALPSPEKQNAGLRREDGATLTAVLQTLPGKRVHELKLTWRTLFGTEPPATLSRDLLMRLIADTMQEAALGGLAPAVKRRLRMLARHADDKMAFRSTLRLKPGTKLVRAWGGTTHTVLVLADGFEFQARRYASLTQIADEITGAHWSGPRFFGVAKARPSKPDSEVHHAT